MVQLPKECISIILYYHLCYHPNHHVNSSPSLIRQCTMLSEKRPVLALAMLSSVICCQALCLAMVGERELSLARESFQSLPRDEQAQWILDQLRSHSSQHSGSFHYQMVIGTTAVCMTAWRLAMGIRRTRMYDVKKRFEGMHKTL